MNQKRKAPERLRRSGAGKRKRSASSITPRSRDGYRDRNRECAVRILSEPHNFSDSSLACTWARRILALDAPTQTPQQGSLFGGDR